MAHIFYKFWLLLSQMFVWWSQRSCLNWFRHRWWHILPGYNRTIFRRNISFILLDKSCIEFPETNLKILRKARTLLTPFRTSKQGKINMQQHAKPSMRENQKENNVTMWDHTTSTILLTFCFIELPGSNQQILEKSKEFFNSPGHAKQRAIKYSIMRSQQGLEEI